MESQKYLNFFQKNLVFLIVTSFIFASFGYLYQSTKPLKYKAELLYQLSSAKGVTTDKEIAECLSIADHLVTLVRSPNLQSQLGFSNDQISSVRFSPIAFKLEVVSANPNVPEIAIIGHYVETAFNQQNLYGKYLLTRVGNIYTSRISNNESLVTIFGLAFGLSLSIIISLIKAYFANY